MWKKIIVVVLLGMIFFGISGCGSKGPNTKLFTSNASATITLEESMTFYKSMDVNGPKLGSVNPGKYKVIDATADKDKQGTWVRIEFKGVKGYVFGVLVKD
jgi:hypothetical protein